jgi:hypothetical protein
MEDTMSQMKFETIVVSAMVAITLLVTYPLCMNLYQLDQQLKATEVGVDKLSEDLKSANKQLAHLEGQTDQLLPPVIASAVVEFLEVATTQTPSKMVPIALTKGDDLPVDPPKKSVAVKVLGGGRVSVLDDCQTAKPEPYENPDGDGAAYQEDVVGYVYQAEDAPSYVLDVPSDYPSP